MWVGTHNKGNIEVSFETNNHCIVWTIVVPNNNYIESQGGCIQKPDLELESSSTCYHPFWNYIPRGLRNESEIQVPKNEFLAAIKLIYNKCTFNYKLLSTIHLRTSWWNSRVTLVVICITLL